MSTRLASMRLPISLERASTLPLLFGMISLFLSGAASLMAQIVINKYTTVVAGGMDAVIMNMTAFTFISGLALGGLASGIFSKNVKRVSTVWCRVELLAGFLCSLFIVGYANLHEVSFRYFSSFGFFQSIGYYYFYVFVLNFMTAAILAFTMGLNYPLAFEAIRRKAGISGSFAAISILFVNTLGAATGSKIAESLVIRFDLRTTLLISSMSYILSGVFAWMVQCSGPKEKSEKEAGSSTSGQLSLSRASCLIFVTGMAGFSIELFLLKVNSIRRPFDHTIYGTVVSQYLILWSAGCGLAYLNRFKLEKVFAWFIYFLAGFSLLLLNYMPDLPDLIYLLPSLLSGWVYGQIHNELKELTTLEVAILTCFNILGCFVGGIITGYVFPTYASLIYAFPFILTALSLVFIQSNSKLISKLAVATSAAAVLILFSLVSLFQEWPHIRFFKKIYQPHEIQGRFEVAEDWSGVAVLNGNNFFVGGIPETPNVHLALSGLRSQQLFLPSALKHNSRIAYVGIAFGISNGLIGELNPLSTIDHFDYFQALPSFWKKYEALNFSLLEQKNGNVKLSDGRLGMKLTQNLYDVVLEFTSGEGVTGISSVKSLEFFQIIKSKMTPNATYISFSRSEEVALTLKKVFKHIYKLRGSPIVLASDQTLENLFDPEKVRYLLSKHLDLKAALEKNQFFVANPALGAPSMNIYEVSLKPGKGRLITDLDPVADYGELLTNLD